ncbi:MAG: hypothetical protein J6Y02_04905 [Pseudobutyrivibrio sp.]|nr:hypothetical protein [Pseudobutyrivibrio sp.]
MAYRCRVFSSKDDGDIEAFEELMTRANETEEVSIVQKESKLTESGEYIIAVHWMEDTINVDNRKTMDSIIDEGL